MFPSELFAFLKLVPFKLLSPSSSIAVLTNVRKEEMKDFCYLRS